MSGYPPSVADFKAYFVRDFTYGVGANDVMDGDIQRALTETRIVFNAGLFSSVEDQNIAYLYASAHFMVLNIQAAGGLSAVNLGRGVQSKGGGTIESKSVGSVNVGFAVPDFVRQSPILSQFMRTDYGQFYLQLLTPRLVGNITVVSGTAPETFAGNVNPLTIATLSLPAGTNGVAYSQTLQAAGGLAPLTWARTSGTLPTGLTLNVNTGRISGTPTVNATYYFTIVVTDANGDTSSMNYQVVVS